MDKNGGATNPENGTVNYAYNINGKLATKTDANGQQIVYTYDTSLRLTEIQRYPTTGTEDICQHTLFYYDTNPFDGSFSQYSYGRPTATQYGAPPSVLGARRTTARSPSRTTCPAARK